MAPRASGTHRFMFAHGGILWQATDYDSVEAETFVFRPGAGLVAVPVLSRRADQPAAQRRHCTLAARAIADAFVQAMFSHPMGKRCAVVQRDRT